MTRGTDRSDWKKASPAARPLRSLDGAELHERFEIAIAARDGTAGAHCIHELWMRAGLGMDIDAALDRLWKSASSSIPDWLPMTHIEWLSTVYDATARFQRRARGHSNVYLILLDYRDRRNGPHGVYVGMSGYSPAQRFDQHKAGIRAAGSVLKRGLEVLTGPTLHLQNISHRDAVRIEAELAVALRDSGLLVEGGH